MRISFLWSERRILSITPLRNRSRKSQQTTNRGSGFKKLSKIDSTDKDMMAMLHNFAEKEIDSKILYFVS